MREDILEASHHHEELVPPKALIAAASLIAFTVVAVLLVRLTGTGAVHMTPPPAVESMDVRFLDGPAGSVQVFDVRDGHLVDTLAPGTNGFVRVVLRGLARERRLGDVGSEPPFRLARHQNGQITLTDLATGKRVDLAAFGATNKESFARFLPQGGAR